MEVKMKKQIFTILIMTIIAVSSSGQSGWYPQTSGTNSLLTDVYFTDSQTGWIVGITNTILHTTDGGANWISQNPAPSVNYFGVHFVDGQTGCAIGATVGGDGKIRRTTDGGLNWEEITVASAYYLWDIYFSDSNKGWIAGGRSWSTNYDPVRTIHHSENGGATWTLQFYQNDSLPLNGIHFTNETIGCAVGDHGTILWTTDGGVNWIQKNSGTTSQLNEVFVLNENTAWVVGISGTILYTTDGGNTWTEYNSGFSAGFGDIIFSDNVNGWIVGGVTGSSLILYTPDGGESWIEQASGAEHALGSVSFADTYYGWAVGNIGTILHTDDGGGVVSIDENAPISNSLRLLTNPNPFSSITTIAYSLSEISKVTLGIYSISGECISILVNEIQNEGLYKVEFNGIEMQQGVYFCTIKTNEGIQTRKIIKL